MIGAAFLIAGLLVWVVGYPILAFGFLAAGLILLVTGH